MAISNAKLAEAKGELIDRVGAICKMTREEMLVELPQVCGFKPANPDQTQEPELIYVLVKFAILGILK